MQRLLRITFQRETDFLRKLLLLFLLLALGKLTNPYLSSFSTNKIASKFEKKMQPNDEKERFVLFLKNK